MQARLARNSGLDLDLAHGIVKARASRNRQAMPSSSQFQTACQGSDALMARFPLHDDHLFAIAYASSVLVRFQDAYEDVNFCLIAL